MKTAETHPSTRLSRRLFLCAGATFAGEHLVEHGGLTKALVSWLAPDNTSTPIAASDLFDTVGFYKRGDISRSDRLSRTALNYARKHEFFNYLEHRGEINGFVVAAYKRDDDGSKRLGAWNDMLWEVDNIQDPLAKAETIFKWVRQVIAYDTTKSKISDPKYNPTWDQSPQNTLLTGKGVCIDQALLVLESLYRTGFDPKMVKLESMQVENLSTKKIDGHAAVGLHIGDKKYVLDTSDRIGIWHESAYYWPGGFDTEKMMPYMAEGIDETIDYTDDTTVTHELSVEERTPITVNMSTHDRIIADRILQTAKRLPHVYDTMSKVTPIDKSRFGSRLTDLLPMGLAA